MNDIFVVNRLFGFFKFFRKIENQVTKIKVGINQTLAVTFTFIRPTIYFTGHHIATSLLDNIKSEFLEREIMEWDIYLGRQF